MEYNIYNTYIIKKLYMYKIYINNINNKLHTIPTQSYSAFLDPLLFLDCHNSLYLQIYCTHENMIYYNSLWLRWNRCTIFGIILLNIQNFICIFQSYTSYIPSFMYYSELIEMRKRKQSKTLKTVWVLGFSLSIIFQMLYPPTSKCIHWENLIGFTRIIWKISSPKNKNRILVLFYKNFILIK